MSVQYGTHVRTILLITVNGAGTNAWGGGIIYGWTYTLMRWISDTPRLTRDGEG